MRIIVTVPAILLAGFALSGCVASTTPVGVLPRDPVPPPPSMSGQTLQRSAAGGQAGATTQRRGLSVPSRSAAPRS
jgi:hypothetical protein